MSIHNDTSITRKRTREEVEESDIEIDGQPFFIKDPTNPFSRPRIFTPICLLSRAQLPLATLDTATSGSRTFAAHVAALEASADHGDPAAVLVAKERDGGRLFALERVKRRCYALCRLGEWVTEAEVKERARIVLQHVDFPIKRHALESTRSGVPWWKSAAVDDLPALAMQRVMDAPQKTSKSVETAEEQAVVPAESEEAPQPDPPAPRAQTSPDVLKELARHYLEALYLTRTSLAYFTKGPLSRARAAFTLPDSTNHFSELIFFLRDSILSSTIMDKKYRDSVAAVVKEMTVLEVEGNEKAKRKRRKWKAKRDRSGFFIDEQEYVERWWRAEDGNERGMSSAEKMEATIRKRSTRIRNRETFLQIVLVLEVLALEAATPTPVEVMETTSDTQHAETPPLEEQALAEAKKRKPKKLDLPPLLETLLDKLCIWHSLESQSPAKAITSTNHDTSDEHSDELKSFCVEVILPFYTSRIPQYASVVNKKLGGPSPPTPAKRHSATSRKPGDPATRQPPAKKPRNPLARVSTETLNRTPKAWSERPPSLQRSATDSETALHIKREGSEVPMDSIPLVQSHSAHSRRSSLFASQLKTFSKREVDLSAISATNEAKMRKKKDVDAKLKEAVEILKKPNRALAVKEIEERTDEQFATVRKKGKANYKVLTAKDKATAVVPEKTGENGRVHVTSTPKHGRTLKATPRKPFNPVAIPKVGSNESNVTHVRSSSSRLPADPTLSQATSTPAILQTGHRSRFSTKMENVQETPSRGFAKFMPAALARQPGTLDSPIMNKTQAAVQQTPSKPSVNRLAQPLVAVSPNLERTRPMAGDVGSQRHSESIYDALGWDDDGYEELA